MNLTRDISKAGSSEIAPAVIVVVDRGKSPAALPAEIRECDTLEALALDVAPQADSRRAGVCEGQVHPAVFIEIECDDADGRWKIFLCEIDAGQRRKFPFTRVQVDRRALATAGKNEIDSAIIVEIGSDEAGAGCVYA